MPWASKASIVGPRTAWNEIKAACEVEGGCEEATERILYRKRCHGDPVLSRVLKGVEGMDKSVPEGVG